MSLDAEIRASAKQIYESGMAEAMRAAALMIVARKLDEVRTILGAAGINANSMGGLVGSVQPFQQRAPQAPPPPVEHPCFQCGQPGVRKSRTNQWDRVGRWACAVHVPLIAKEEYDDRVDASILGPQAGPKTKAPAIVQQAPTVMAKQEEMMVMEPPAGAGSLTDAMASLGVPE
jgi:hypothetical protein